MYRNIHRPRFIWSEGTDMHAWYVVCMRRANSNVGARHSPITLPRRGSVTGQWEFGNRETCMGHMSMKPA